MYKGDPYLEKGIAATYNDILEGKVSKNKGKPIVVEYIAEEDKYLVMDGYHRIVEGLLEGNKKFDCEHDQDGRYSHLFWIPEKKDRFSLLEIKE